MGANDMVFTLPNLEPIGSEFVSMMDTDDEPYPGVLPPLPHPTPTDFNNLFTQDKDQEKVNARRQKPGHIPRPRNAFILFRSDFVQQRVPEDVVNDHRDLSRLAGCMWRKMSDAQKRPWFEKAELERRHHSEVFPEYRYSPVVPDRPKRIYRKKKPAVPEEILLMYPQSRSEPPKSPPQYPALQTSILVSPSEQKPRSRLPPLPDLCVYPPETRQCQGFPQSYARYPPDPARALPSHHTSSFERPLLSSPGVLCTGFADVPRQSSSLSSVQDWEFSLPELNAYETHAGGHWPTSEKLQGGSSQDAVDVAYHDQAEMNTSMEAQDDPDTLYSMWKELGIFHSQSFHSVAEQHIPFNSRYPYSDFFDPSNPSHPSTSFMRSSKEVSDPFQEADQPLSHSS